MSAEEENPFKKELIENEDFYYTEQGYKVFTEKYHLKRGYCCQNGCRHCPYGFNDKKKKTE
jgi:Family of unknown function (DUF5522)